MKFETYKYWVSAKIKADPVNYTLSDNLYINDSDKDIRVIYDKNYAIEQKIHKALMVYKDIHKPLQICNKPNPKFTDFCSTYYICNNTNTISAHTLDMYVDVNTYINENCIYGICEDIDIEPEKFFKSISGNAFLQLIYKLENSIDAKNNMQILLSDLNFKDNVKNILTLNYIKNFYENDYKYSENLKIPNICFIPIHSFEYDDEGIVTPYCKDFSKYNKNIIFLYTLEILYQIINLDEITANILLEIIFKSRTSDITYTSKFLNKDFTIKQEILDLFVPNAIDRIIKMYDYVLTHNLEILDLKTCPFTLAVLIKFTNYVMYRAYRFNIRNVYNELAEFYKLKLHVPIASLDNMDMSSEMEFKTATAYTDLEHITESSPVYEASKKDELDKIDTKFTSHAMHTLDILDSKTFIKKINKYEFEVDTVNTNSKVSEICKKGYNTLKTSLGMLTTDLIKQIKEIKVYNTGGKETGKLKGKLDKKNLYKYNTDHRIFYDNTYKIKESDLAFGIILDVSGSMSGEGIKNGKLTMILLHEVLSSLRINHEIITHTSSSNYNSIIQRYKLFNENKLHTVNKVYDILNIKALTGNCDSGALYFMQQELHRVKNKDKIVLMFSDGEPTECTGKDLIDQVKSMEREGIVVIGIGINYPAIKSYYSRNANGKDIKDMVDIITNILKEYVLEKN